MSISKATITVLKKANPALLDKIVETAARLQRVKVGVPTGAGAEPEGTPIALVAAVHEYGTQDGHIPERPWLRNTIRAHLDDYKRLNRINVIKSLQGKMEPEVAMQQLGMMAKGHVQDFIANNDYKLNPNTEKQKGSTRALIDSGNFRQSINYVIEPEGSSA